MELGRMNRILHLILKFLYALVLLGTGAKHLYNIYWGDASVMTTGYPEPEAQAFVTAVLATGFLLPFICVAKLIAGVLILLPGREQLGVLIAFPYAVGMLVWGVAMVPSHLAIMVAIFVVNAMLVYANWDHYSPLLKAK